MDIVYNRSAGDDQLVVFAERGLAETVTQVRRAMNTATTWREFAAGIPEAEWRELQEEWQQPDPDAPFDEEDLPGVADGDYPPGLAARMVEWLPAEVVRRYAHPMTALSGDVVELPWAKADAIAADLRARGHHVELRTDLDLS